MNKLDVIKRKIKYRSKYRGIKEMDIILSKFVKKYIDLFNYEELLELHNILEKDDDLIFKWYSSDENASIKKNKVSR